AAHRDREELGPRAHEKCRRRGALAREARRAADRRLETRHGKGSGGPRPRAHGPRSLSLRGEAVTARRAPRWLWPLLLIAASLAGARRAGAHPIDAASVGSRRWSATTRASASSTS